MYENVNERNSESGEKKVAAEKHIIYTLFLMDSVQWSMTHDRHLLEIDLSAGPLRLLMKTVYLFIFRHHLRAMMSDVWTVCKTIRHSDSDPTIWKAWNRFCVYKFQSILFKIFNIYFRSCCFICFDSLGSLFFVVVVDVKTNREKTGWAKRNKWKSSKSRRNENRLKNVWYLRAPILFRLRVPPIVIRRSREFFEFQ